MIVHEACFDYVALVSLLARLSHSSADWEAIGHTSCMFASKGTLSEANIPNDARTNSGTLPSGKEDVVVSDTIDSHG